MEIHWIMIAVLVLIILLGILVVFSKKFRKGKLMPVDYYNYFILGIVWIGIGTIWIDENPFFFIMGLVFLIIGLMHQKEWKRGIEDNKWENLNKTERNIRIALLIILGILVLVGLVFFLSSIV